MPSPPDRLEFSGETIKGYISHMALHPRQLVTYRAHYPGTRGQSELVAGTAGRTIQIFMTLDDSRWSSQTILAAFITNVLQDQLVGQHGNLTTVTKNRYPTFRDCTYEGFSLEVPILPDVAGTMSGKAFCSGVFVFRQLK